MGKLKNHGIPESAKDMMKHFGKDAFRLNAYEKKFIQDFGFDTVWGCKYCPDCGQRLNWMED